MNDEDELGCGCLFALFVLVLVVDFLAYAFFQSDLVR